MNSANQLLFIGKMVLEAIESYRSGTPPRLPKGFAFVQSFGTSTDPRLGFIAESQKHVIVVFRGTENATDILNGLDMTQTPFPHVTGAGMTHRGFTLLYGQLRQQLWDALKLSRIGAKRLYMGGHSLGAALAMMTALDVAANAKPVRPTVVTFGSPRVGSAAFAVRYNTMVPHTTRISNAHDLVPHFPPETLGYRHVNRELTVRFERGSNHAMSGYYDALCKAFPKACQNQSL